MSWFASMRRRMAGEWVTTGRERWDTRKRFHDGTVYQVRQGQQLHTSTEAVRWCDIEGGGFYGTVIYRVLDSDGREIKRAS